MDAAGAIGGLVVFSTRADRIRKAQRELREIGFPVGAIDGRRGPKTKECIRLFKRGWCGNRPLRSDSRLTKRTKRAIEWSANHGGRLGHKAPHFRYREFASSTTSCPGNGVIKITRRQGLALEALRRAVGALSIINGYRDPRKNGCVGGADCSMHTDACGHEGGQAADVNTRRTLSQMKALRLFTGLGVSRSSGIVVHVDTRPGSVDFPVVWFYP
jgi:hypothetical protein